MLLLTGLIGICVGTYALLDQTAPRWLVLPGLVGGVAIAVGGFWSAGRRVQRTRYRPDHWRAAEIGVALSGLAVAVGVLGVLRGDPVLYPPLDAFPTVTTECPPRGAAGDDRGVRLAPTACSRSSRSPGRRWLMLELRDVASAIRRSARCSTTSTSPSRRASWCWSQDAPAWASRPCSACSTAWCPRSRAARLSGDVLLDGASIVHLPPRDRAHVVGYVGQDPTAGFVTDTVEEELAYGMEQLGLDAPTMRRRVEETLDLLGIADLRGRDLRTLSGGQQQRVAIGSVLTMHPRVLVLDEPTSALDPTAAEDVLATLTRLVSDVGVTVVVAEHRLERVAPFADRIVLVRCRRDRAAPVTPRRCWPHSPVAPPIVELGRWAGWTPLPLTRAGCSPPRRGQHARAGAAAPSAESRTRISCSTARAVTVSYGRYVAVRDVDLRLAAGQVTALMGRNGSGKSTLMWALQGTRKRDRGTVGWPARTRPCSAPRLAAGWSGWCRRRLPTCSTWKPSRRSARLRIARLVPRKARRAPCSSASRPASTPTCTRGTCPRASGSRWFSRSC